MAAKCNANFRIEAEFRGLKDNTISALIEQDYDSEDALRHMDDEYMISMGISKGQQGLLRQWVQQLSSDRGSHSEHQCDVHSQAVCAHQTAIIHDDPDALDIAQCATNLQVADRAESAITAVDVVQCRDDGPNDDFQSILDEYKQCRVDVAVIGRSGTGKSSLINCLRNLRATDAGAAAVGVKETTIDICSYKFPDCDKFLLWDLPGVNTHACPRASYLQTVDFDKYDAFIIVCTDRVTVDDIWLAQEVHSKQKPFYFVRTKVDQDITNSKADGVNDEDTVLGTIRRDIQEKLIEAKLALENILLVSSRLEHQSKWDFSKLVCLLAIQTPSKQFQTLVMSMVSSSEHMIQLKRDELDKRIRTVALKAASTKKTAEYQEVLLTEIREYVKCLGTTDLNIEKWKVDVNRLKPKLRRIKRSFDRILIWLSVKEKPIFYLDKLYCSLSNAVDIPSPFKEKLEKIQHEIDAKTEAKKEECSMLKKQVATDILMKALEKCRQLAIGIIETRKRLPI